MTDPVLVQAGWAVWGKPAGTRADYNVLAASTGMLSAGEFYQLLKHFTPGNPGAEQGTPGSLPWVMLSRVGVGDEFYLGISVQVPTDHRDGTGRPISRTSYFCVPYAELAGRPVSYDGLYTAVAAHSLPPDGGSGSLTLAIPPLDIAALARVVREFGEPTVAATAAMLLGGPVTITGPGLPDLRSRLLFCDAVAALLPYGYRPYLTAATWSDAGADDRFRLVFANRARDEASRAQWGMPPRLPAGQPASAYLGYLHRALGTAASDDGRLESLIGYLAGEGEPRKFEEPTLAIDILHGFFLPELLSEAADLSQVRPGDLRQVFTSGRVRELPAARRARLLQWLISLADLHDFELISQWYDEIAAGDPGELLTDVAKVCLDQLWSAGSAGLARDYLRFLGPRGLSDDLLARLVVHPERPADPAAGLDAIGQLLADFVIGIPGGPALYPQTREALGHNGAAAAALLAGLAASWRQGAQSLDVAADWLEPVTDGVVRPFVSLLGDAFGSGAGAAPEPVSGDALHELDRDGGPESVRYLLRAASYRHRLHLVLPGLADWLVSVRAERGPLSAQEGLYWHDVTMELTAEDSDQAAWVDLVLLVTGNEPRALRSGRYGQPQFAHRLAAAWRELAIAVPRHGGQAADQVLEDALLGFLERTSWRGEQGLADAVRNLVDSLTAGGPRPRLTAVVLNPREVLRQMPPGSRPARIAQACLRAYADGLPPERAAALLAESRAVTGGSQACLVLEELQRVLVAANARTASFAWPMTFVRLFLAGSFGDQVAVEFPRLAAGRFSEELEFRVMLLNAILAGARPDIPPPINDNLADYLDKNRHDLEELVREARRRSRGGFVGRLRGGGKPAQVGPGGQADAGGQASAGGQSAEPRTGESHPGGHGGPS